MKADCINNIVNKYDELPYRCILVDGAWGVGKTYEIKKALNNRPGVYYISMFGIKDPQDIYHEILFKLVTNGNEKIKRGIEKLDDVATVASLKIPNIKPILNSLIKEKEILLTASKNFTSYHYIVIDDLERMNDNIGIEEVFGIIDELKRSNYIKIILVANKKEIAQEEMFEKYSEKIIDRTYSITEHSKDIDWEEMNIERSFIVDFLSKHNVKNLRTLQKAQLFYDDVRLIMESKYNADFYVDMKLLCYAIVVESIEKLYYKDYVDGCEESVTKVLLETRNKFENRIINNYIRGSKFSNAIVSLIKMYYESEMEICQEDIDAEYQSYIQAGDKGNYYKSDDELRKVLPVIVDKIKKETSIYMLMKHADEYFIWSEIIGVDNEALKVEYKEKLYNMLFQKSLEGDFEYLLYGIDEFYIQSDINKIIVKDMIIDVKKNVVKEYVRHIVESTDDEKSYDYSYLLKKFIENSMLKDYIVGNVDELYIETSLPICIYSERHYRTIYNVMSVLYYENKQKFLDYCEKVKLENDNMSKHRIDNLLKEISRDKH